MLIFVGVFLKVDVGTGRLVPLEAAAAGGTYNIVIVFRSGSSTSVWNSGMRTSANNTSDGSATDPTAAQGLSARDFLPDITRLS
jgi:hypothetical protein